MYYLFIYGWPFLQLFLFKSVCVSLCIWKNLKLVVSVGSLKFWWKLNLRLVICCFFFFKQCSVVFVAKTHRVYYFWNGEVCCNKLVPCFFFLSWSFFCASITHLLPTHTQYIYVHTSCVFSGARLQQRRERHAQFLEMPPLFLSCRSQCNSANNSLEKEMTLQSVHRRTHLKQTLYFLFCFRSRFLYSTTVAEQLSH